jgi:hypothetical protein
MNIDQAAKQMVYQKNFRIHSVGKTKETVSFLPQTDMTSTAGIAQMLTIHLRICYYFLLKIQTLKWE